MTNSHDPAKAGDYRRAALLTKNEQARSRVEAMILRLKSLEQNA